MTVPIVESVLLADKNCRGKTRIALDHVSTLQENCPSTCNVIIVIKHFVLLRESDCLEDVSVRTCVLLQIGASRVSLKYALSVNNRLRYRLPLPIAILSVRKRVEASISSRIFVNAVAKRFNTVQNDTGNIVLKRVIALYISCNARPVVNDCELRLPSPKVAAFARNGVIGRFKGKPAQKRLCDNC